MFENLLNVWTHYGRQPHYSEINKPPSQIKSRRYINRFGTWRKALISFIEFMERDSSEVPNQAKIEDSLVPTAKSSKQIDRKQPEDSRNISLGLRFKVLHRDHFKCILCGDNPPASPGLILHVDHITAVVKGREDADIIFAPYAPTAISVAATAIPIKSGFPLRRGWQNKNRQKLIFWCRLGDSNT